MSGPTSAFSSPKIDVDSSRAILTFGLHHRRTLRIALLANVEEPAEKAKRLSSVVTDTSGSSTAGDELVGGRRPDGGGRGHHDGRFAILASDRVISIEQVMVAANAALIREHHRLVAAEASDDRQSSSSRPNDTQIDGEGVSDRTTDQHSGEEGGRGKRRPPRGIALDTVFCVGGSLNEASVLRDFGFQGEGAQNMPANVILIGFDCTSEEMDETVGLVGGTPFSISKLSRQRTEEEVKDLIKVYKLSKQETEGGTDCLANAVISRIATKQFG